MNNEKHTDHIGKVVFHVKLLGIHNLLCFYRPDVYGNRKHQLIM